MNNQMMYPGSLHNHTDFSQDKFPFTGLYQ